MKELVNHLVDVMNQESTGPYGEEWGENEVEGKLIKESQEELKQMMADEDEQ